jgi:hypothetical protein
MCDKRGFKGKRSARASIQHLHHTMRVYRCDECGRYHLAKRERRRKPLKP